MFAMISKILKLGCEQVVFEHNFCLMGYISIFHIQKQ